MNGVACRRGTYSGAAAAAGAGDTPTVIKKGGVTRGRIAVGWGRHTLSRRSRRHRQRRAHRGGAARTRGGGDVCNSARNGRRQALPPRHASRAAAILPMTVPRAQLQDAISDAEDPAGGGRTRHWWRSRRDRRHQRGGYGGDPFGHLSAVGRVCHDRQGAAAVGGTGAAAGGNGYSAASKEQIREDDAATRVGGRKRTKGE